MLVVTDKRTFYHDLAHKAQMCSLNGDFSGTFKVVRSLSGYAPQPMKVVKTLSGQLTFTEEERQQRWQEYFCTLLAGTIEPSSHRAMSESLSCIDSPFHISPEWTARVISELGNNAHGEDQLSANVLKAGGDALAIKVNEIENRSILEERVPIRWKGSRLVDLYKKKGNPTECSSHRGLQIADHLAKSFVGKLRDTIKTQVEEYLPCDQFWGVKGGGTDYPVHIIQSMVSYAALAKLSVFVLFVDLVAAYDSVVREIALGLPHNLEEDGESYLRSIGLSSDVAKHVLEFLENGGPVLERIGVDAKIIRLINALHTKAWARYGALASVVVTTKGGRQGCKLGGVIFAIIFGQVMANVRARLSADGILLKTSFCEDSPFWNPSACPGDLIDHEVGEATFVDDTAIALVASSPKVLMKYIETLLVILIEEYSRVGLLINFGKGKTEALLRLRGKNATKYLDSLRHEGSLSFELPKPYENHRLRIVESYKHLGSYLSISDSLMHDAQHRCSAALSAYVPIAQKIFASPYIGHWLKIHFMGSLVLSRLLYNTQTWVLQQNALRKINDVYMRVLRRFCRANLDTKEGNAQTFR